MQLIKKYKVKEHLDIKDQILTGILDTRRKYRRRWGDMTASDYALTTEEYSGPLKGKYTPVYRSLFINTLSHYFWDYSKSVGAGGCRFGNIWFAQYHTEGASFDWHTHENCNMSAVYNLELENSLDATEFKSFKFNEPVKEGDLIIFPSMIPHRGPPSVNRKTVIGINFNIMVS